MSEKQRILIVDDEPQITRVLRTSLTSHGYDVRSAADGESALETYGDWRPDLVLTDLSMPNLNGIAGGDDYITKPCGMDELLARIRAALRRVPATQTEESALTVLEAGDFHVDLEARSVTVQGRALHLTPKEYDLLVYMIRHPGKVLTHRTLLAAVWGGNYV